MNTVENQKVIVIRKDPADKGHPYSIINLSAIDTALKTLNNSEFKVWAYLAKNQNDFEFGLSRVAVCRDCNITKPTYLNAVNALIEKGFLCQKASGSNVYIFYEGGAESNDPDNTTIIQIPANKVEARSKFVF